MHSVSAVCHMSQPVRHTHSAVTRCGESSTPCAVTHPSVSPTSRSARCPPRWCSAGARRGPGWCQAGARLVPGWSPAGPQRVTRDARRVATSASFTSVMSLPTGARLPPEIPHLSGLQSVSQSVTQGQPLSTTVPTSTNSLRRSWYLAYI